MRGLNILELLTGNDPEWREEVFVQISEDHVGRALRTDRWKYSVRATGNGWDEMDSPAYAEDSLFDLEKDPHERKNLVADPELSDLRAELSTTLVRRMVLAGEAGPEISGAL
jgi:arylsulfatase A-like enzyme